MMLSIHIAGLIFQHPWWLAALGLIPALILIHRFRAIEYFASVRFSSTVNLPLHLSRGRQRAPGLVKTLRYIAFALLVISMARPQWPLRNAGNYTEGIDIMITMDISLSMLARDFSPDRLEASKDVAARFVRERGNDRTGLVVFAGQPFTLCPLTGDKAAMITLLQQAQAGFIEDGSTAIGDGIATAINRLRDSDAKSRVIILLTDGENNAGNIDPVQASEIAALFGIRLYTIGVGSQGTAIGPVQIIEGNILFGPVEVTIDEKTLRKAAENTGGRYFRALDENGLVEIYREIDRMEKSRLEISTQVARKELFPYLLGLAIVLLMAGWIIQYLFVKTIP